MELYRKAVLAWGLALPESLKRLQNRSDGSVYEALVAVLNDVTSPSWTTDAKIAWALMQGREIQLH